MNFNPQLVAGLPEGDEPLPEDVFAGSREDLRLASVGLTLSEAEELPQRLQHKLSGQPAATHLRGQQPVGLRKQGS